MLIDVHTHVFPTHIAERAISGMVSRLEESFSHCGVRVFPRGDGTVDSLLSSMDSGGCTHSVLCPVVTNEKSTLKTNAFSMAQRSDRLIPFAGLMPSCEGFEAALEEIYAQGFKGIKLHPEYQGFDIDGERCIQIVKKAEELGLIVIFHAGVEPAYPSNDRGSPMRIANLLDKVDGSRLIAAHLGGWLEWEAADKYLSGSPIYFDTANIAGYIEPEACKQLIRSHGADKILFGSDFPWNTAADTLALLHSLGLSDTEMSSICSKNAEALLFADA